MKIASGLNWGSMHQSFRPILYASSSLWHLNTVAPSNKGIVKMHFVNVSSLQTRLQLSSHPTKIQKLPKTNICSSTTHCTGHAAAQDIHIWKLNPFSISWVYIKIHTMHVSSLVTSLILWTQWAHHLFVYLTLGLYVDNFVYFSKDSAVKVKFPTSSRHLIEKTGQTLDISDFKYSCTAPF